MTLSSLFLNSITDCAWANEFIIGCLNLLLQRPLHVYSITQHKEHQNFLYSLNLEHEAKIPVTIAHNINHFVALMPKTLTSSAPNPGYNYFNFNIND
jgi:hypothetical protein